MRVERKFRMVTNYRELNDLTIEGKYPLPRIEYILENFGKCAYFTTLDLAQGFHQIPVDYNSTGFYSSKRPFSIV